jgi:DNA polymerase III alpha subunit
MFAVADERTIRYGLGAIKGVGQAAVEACRTSARRAGRSATSRTCVGGSTSTS